MSKDRSEVTRQHDRTPPGLPLAAERLPGGQDHELSYGMIRAIAEGIFCLDPEPPYRIRFANPFAISLLNLPEAAIVGQHLAELLCIQAQSVHGPEHVAESLKPLDAIAFEAEVTCSGRTEGFFAALTLVWIDGSVGRMLVLTVQDVTHRRRAEQSQRLSGKVFEVCSEAIVITDVQGFIISVNPAFTWLTGYRPDEAIGQTPRLLKSDRHDADFYSRMWTQLLAEGSWSGEIWDRRKDGSVYPKWTTINAVWENGSITHFVSLFHDISESKAHESSIQYLAEHDALTGLPNRRLLEDRVARLIASEREADREFAVILIDLDRFKQINDSLGHQVGDRVLVEVARRLSQEVRSTDTVARLGGDEFVVLLAGMADPASLTELIGKLHRALGEPLRVDGRPLRTPPSMGIALYPKDGNDIDTLLRNADAAMYQTKAQGRNGWTFFTEEIRRRMEERQRLMEALRLAIDQGGLAVHFQPLLDADSGQIASWEALLRWQHPELGEVSPEKIIALAEETGLIHPLGNWVISTACREARRWEESGLGRFRVSVNISPLQLEHEELEEKVLAALREAGLEAERLELEITENIFMSNSDQALAALENLRRRGVLVTLDDFGTGYSSLGYLRRMPVDRVKIDSSLVSKVTTDRSEASIVQAVVSLARSLDLAVVAEGVETPEQHAFLRHHCCTEVQGFLLGQPMPSPAVAHFLQGRLPAASPAAWQGRV